MEPNPVAGIWFKIAAGWKDVEAAPENPHSLAKIQQTLDLNFGRIQSSFDFQARANWISLRSLLQQKCVDSTAKQAVLTKLDVLCQTRLGQEVVDPYEKKIDEIEANLPEDCFPPFNRDGSGRVIAPRQQLEQFTKRLQAMARDLDEFSFIKYERLPLHLYGLMNVDTSSTDFLNAAKLIVDYNFLKAFYRDLEPFNLSQGRTISQSAQEGRIILTQKGITLYDTNFQKIVFVKIVIVPPEIAFLKQLRTVEVVPISVLYLPRCLKNMGVESIRLRQGRLQEVPDVLWELPDLKSLFLGHNAIRSLPSDLSHLHKLETIELESNQITEIPVFPPSLKVLNIKNNRISQVSPNIGFLTNLETLTLTDNPIAFIDQEIGHCTSLRYLECNREILPYLPQELQNCTRLSAIHDGSLNSYWKNTPGQPTLENFLRNVGTRKRKLL